MKKVFLIAVMALIITGCEKGHDAASEVIKKTEPAGVFDEQSSIEEYSINNAKFNEVLLKERITKYFNTIFNLDYKYESLGITAYRAQSVKKYYEKDESAGVSFGRGLVYCEWFMLDEYSSFIAFRGPGKGKLEIVDIKYNSKGHSALVSAKIFGKDGKGLYIPKYMPVSEWVYENDNWFINTLKLITITKHMQD